MRATAPWIVLLLTGAWAATACAGDDGPDADVLVSGNEPPRFIRIDMPAETQRSLPGYRTESNQLSYRWWASSGRADVGVGIGTLSYVARPSGNLPGLADGGASSVLASATVLTLGMRYRTSEHSTLFADAARVGHFDAEGGDAVVGRFGLEFKAAQSNWHIAYGGLGLRLGSDTRMTLRLRRGGLGVYMRSTF